MPEDGVPAGYPPKAGAGPARERDHAAPSARRGARSRVWKDTSQRDQRPAAADRANAV